MVLVPAIGWFCAWFVLRDRGHPAIETAAYAVAHALLMAAGVVLRVR